MSMSRTVNVPLLRKAVEWAEVEATKPARLSQWNQGAWFERRSSWFLERDRERAAELGINLADCGTACCIAGWVVMAHVGEENMLSDGCRATNPETKRPRTIRLYAQDLLGLTDGQAGDLFAGSNDIHDIRRVAEEIAGETL